MIWEDVSNGMVKVKVKLYLRWTKHHAMKMYLLLN
jgi:hypothetical protein